MREALGTAFFSSVVGLLCSSDGAWIIGQLSFADVLLPLRASALTGYDRSLPPWRVDRDSEGYRGVTPADPADRLLAVIERLAFARELPTVTRIVRQAVTELVRADGATFALRVGDECHYVDEDAIGPLRKGQRCPLSACLSGWVMLAKEPAVVPDIAVDPRIPLDAYKGTFVKSLVMIPVRSEDPIAAIGAYWRTPHEATRGEVARLEFLANAATLALTNVQLVQEATAREGAAGEQREWFRVALRSIGDAVMATDPRGTITLMNPVAEAVTGWPEHDAIGRPLDEVFRIVNENTGAQVESPVARVLREGTVVGLANHTVLIRRDGDRVPIDDSGAPIRTETGELAGVVLVFRDVTERRRAEDAEARLAGIVRTSDDAIVSKDLHGIVRSWNPAAERMFGFTSQEAIGQSITLIIPPERRAEEDEVLRRIRRGEAVDHFETVRVRKDGRAIDISLTVSPVRNTVGDIIGASKIARDITERKRVEAERALLLQREQGARAEAEAANHAKDQFLATLSHELRTPLQAILGWAGALRRFRDDPANFARAIDTIERNARAQTRLVEDLLDVSRIIAGQMRLAVRPVFLAPVIRAAMDSLAPAAEAKALRVVAILDPDAGPVTGDPDRLQQVVWNLLSNAVKFTPKGGQVQVTLERVNSHIQIRVMDTGPGIAPEFLPFLFERFRQAEGGTTSSPRGLGLGLAIVRHLVELHGGTVHADSPGEGQGAVFTVRLPLRPVSRPEEAPPGMSAGRLPVAPASLARRHVLVVEDETDARELLRVVLEHAGATVVAVGTVGEAMAAFEQQRPDVLVSDLEMPGENGYDLIRHVRARGPDAGGDVLAIALTAYAGPEDRIRTLTAGFDTHVAKPVVADELVALVTALWRRRRP
jgi:PAS domain S-box-containing protein